jgi:hypothetical protein
MTRTFQKQTTTQTLQNSSIDDQLTISETEAGQFIITLIKLFIITDMKEKGITTLHEYYNHLLFEKVIE